MSEGMRLLLAGLVCLCWLALVGGTLWRHRRRKAAPVAPGAVLVIYASQTGTGASLAKATAEALEVSGRSVALRSLAAVTPAMLGEADEALFIAATTGEGDAPDDAAAFLTRFDAAKPDLSGLHYAVLALGDTHYRHFCAFGHSLDRLLHDAGAVPVADLVEVDQGDAGALRHWQQNLRLFGASAALPDWEAPRYARWVLAGRELLNPGSAGGPMYRITLTSEGEIPAWAAGDIAEVYPGPVEEAFLPKPPLPHRDYSLATIPEEGELGLVVRLFRDEQGCSGLGSGFLCERAEIGAGVALRIRSNPRFHTPASQVPLILIGNGTGISSLRAHLKAREPGTSNWLIYGERDPLHDRPYAGEINGWLSSGHLARLDLAFSRAAEGGYVQDEVRRAADMLRVWVSGDAAILLCGSVAMGEGVDAALREVLGEAEV
ncbi:MAG TPA: sulfite reductase subunit alpha, partial [Sphingomonadaceae bacterium]|nr:sulfite reductase subunit alpha [Sphingomonadaceae bacterium]